jgi:hypothetical protein
MSTGGDNVGVHDNSRGWIWYWNGSATTFDFGYTQFAGSARAPIFYDSDNTGYYLDPASTSEINKVYYNSNMVSRNYGIGQVGLYSSYRYQAVFAMGEAYILPADGTSTGSLYGIAWSHPNAGGVAANLNTHGALLMENGTFLCALSSSIRAAADMRAPIFYDQNNTGYYVDPNSTSNLFRLTLNPGTIGVATGLYVNGGDITAARSSTTGVIYFGTSGSAYLYHDGSSYIFGSIGGYTITDASFRAPIFYDSNNTAYYADFAATGDSIRAAGNIVAYYSDERLKKHLGKIENALDKVDQLEGFYYEANELAQRLGYKVKREVGVSAQAVQRVLPEIVTDAPIDARYLTIDYERLVPLLIEAIKELTVEVKTLKSKVH